MLTSMWWPVTQHFSYLGLHIGNDWRPVCKLEAMAQWWISPKNHLLIADQQSPVTSKGPVTDGERPSMMNFPMAKKRNQKRTIFFHQRMEIWDIYIFHRFLFGSHHTGLEQTMMEPRPIVYKMRHGRPETKQREGHIYPLVISQSYGKSSIYR